MLPYVDVPFQYLGNALGAGSDELKLIFLFLSSYPLAALLKRIPDRKPEYKNAFIVAVSIFYLVGLFDMWGGVRTIAISSVGAYAIAYCIHGPWMPWIGFVFLMGHMSVSHVWRKYYTAPGTIDITGAQMVLVMKLTAFCWNVHDGRLRDEDMNEQQRDYAVRELPAYLDYAAYVLFFPSLMAGPAFDYVEYRRWIETTMFEVPPGTDPLKAPRTRKKRKIPRSGTPAMLKAGAGLLWILAFLQLGSRYPPQLLLSEEMTRASLLRRVWYMHMAGFTVRTKYYGVWALAEGSCILSGIGYKGIDPKTGRVDWRRLQNVNPLGVELAQNSRAYLGNWNINTNNWLRNYMYLRVTPKGKKPGFRASMATFVTSAFWHGFEPGYYLAFVLAAFIQTVAKNCRRFVRPFFLSPDGSRPLKTKIYFDLASWAATQLAFSFTVAPFYLLSLNGSLLCWRRVWFYCPLGVALLIGFFASPGKAVLVRRLKARGVPHQQTKTSSSSSLSSAEPPAAKRSRPSLAAAGGFESTDNTLTGDGLQLQPGQELENLRTMGIPDDLQTDVDELVEEVRAEMERRKGSSAAAGLPDAEQLRRTVARRLDELKRSAREGVTGEAAGGGGGGAKVKSG